MAAKDLLGVIKGLRLVLSSCGNNTVVEATHVLNNSSLRPILSTFCRSCEKESWEWKDTDLEIPDFPEFGGESLDGAFKEVDWDTSDLLKPSGVADIPSNGNSVSDYNGKRQFHTWCRRRYQTDAESAADTNIKRTERQGIKKDYRITRNQQVLQL